MEPNSLKSFNGGSKFNVIATFVGYPNGPTEPVEGVGNCIINQYNVMCAMRNSPLEFKAYATFRR
jgi:hypothetical protein